MLGDTWIPAPTSAIYIIVRDAALRAFLEVSLSYLGRCFKDGNMVPSHTQGQCGSHAANACLE